MYDFRLQYQGRAPLTVASLGDPRVVGLAIFGLILVGVAIAALASALPHLDLGHAGFGLLALGAGPIAVDYSGFNPSPSTARIGEALAKLREDQAGYFKAAQTADGYDMSGEKVAEVRKQNEAITKKAEEYEAAVEIDRTAFANAKELERLNGVKRPLVPEGPAGPGPSAKALSFNDIFAAKMLSIDELAQFKQRGAVSLDLPRVSATSDLVPMEVGTKTLMTLSSIAPQADRQPGYVPSAVYLSDVTDLFLQGTTTSNVLEFELETTYTSNAAETAEGTANTDAALAFTNTQFTVREINEWIPVGRQTLQDNAGLMSYIQGRLLHMLDVRRSSELMAGDGNSPNIKGVLNFSGIQSQAKGTDPTPDAVFKAMTLVRTTGDAEPTAAVFHAQDWQDIRLLRTDNGIYIWGSPSDVAPARIWGLDVRVSNSITQNTGLVGAFKPYAQIFYNGGTVVEISTEHSTYFTERKAAILAAQQLALVSYRDAAFCKVTGI